MRVENPVSRANYPSQRPAPTLFEETVARLGLSPEQYCSSTELREWVVQNKDVRYVPTLLLTHWGYDVEKEF
jgi:hypothetical protein